MKTIRLFLLAFISFGAMFYSCETIELEVLDDPNNLTDEQSDPNLLLNSIQRAFVTNMTIFNDRGSDLTRIDYVSGRTYGNMYTSGAFDGTWSRAYSNIFANTAIIVTADEDPDQDFSFNVGVAKTLQAYTLFLLVDYLGDIPYSQALNPLEFPNPSLDDDATVYQAAGGLLDEAQAAFGRAGTAAPSNVTDLFYGGTTASWVRLINTLRLRRALTVGDTGTFNSIIAAGNYISSSADDFQFTYGTQELNPDTRHQDYITDYTTSGANIYQSNWLMEVMQGADKSDPADDDPRIRYYFFRQANCTPGASCDPDGDGQFLSCSLETAPIHYTTNGVSYCWLEDGYWGRDHGDDDGTPPDNFLRTAVGVYPAAGLFDDNRFAGLTQGVGGGGAGIEPIILASYIDFWRAEVALASGNAGAAAGFVAAGIQKSADKVFGFAALDASRDTSFESDQAAVDAYIAAQTASITDASDDSWNALAENYFVTLYGGGADAYNFYRRTGYPTTVKPNLEPDPGTFPTVFFYPSVEVIANPNVQQRDLTDRVFWNEGDPVPPAN
ncbi:MAG: SusD/RagB family nutrient-binding outer membrane lipoprotein [Marinirhabdus sp.]